MIMAKSKVRNQKAVAENGRCTRMVNVLNEVRFNSDIYVLPDNVQAVGQKVVLWRDPNGVLRGCHATDVTSLSGDVIFTPQKKKSYN